MFYPISTREQSAGIGSISIRIHISEAEWYAKTKLATKISTPTHYSRFMYVEDIER